MYKVTLTIQITWSNYAATTSFGIFCKKPAGLKWGADSESSKTLVCCNILTTYNAKLHYYPEESHARTNPKWLSHFALLGRRVHSKDTPTQRQIPQWFSWVPVFFGSTCLDINNDIHATEWHMKSTFPIPLSCFSSLHHCFFHRKCLTTVGNPHGKNCEVYFHSVFFIWMNGF